MRIRKEIQNIITILLSEWHVSIVTGATSVSNKSK